MRTIKKTFIAGIAVISIVIMAFAVFAQIPRNLTLPHCGDKIREGYELCEPNTDDNLCPEIGKKMRIAMNCHLLTCGCVPDRKDCGNKVREGTEMCEPTDPDAEDLCPWLGELIGHPLKCDAKTCDCVPDGEVFVISHCGDGKMEGKEECEVDADCRSTERCENCACIKIKEEVIEPPVVIENITAPILPAVEELGLASEENKTLLFGLDPEDFLGKQLSGFVKDKFSDQVINLNVVSESNTTVIGITVKYGVVQEITSVGYSDPSVEILMNESVLESIKKAENTTQAIDNAFKDGKITYKRRGLLAGLIDLICSIFK